MVQIRSKRTQEGPINPGGPLSPDAAPCWSPEGLMPDAGTIGPREFGTRVALPGRAPEAVFGVVALFLPFAAATLADCFLTRLAEPSGLGSPPSGFLTAGAGSGGAA